MFFSVHHETTHQTQLQLANFLVGAQQISELTPGLLHQVFLIFLYDLRAGSSRECAGEDRD